MKAHRRLKLHLSPKATEQALTSCIMRFHSSVVRVTPRLSPRRRCGRWVGWDAALQTVARSRGPPHKLRPPLRTRSRTYAPKKHQFSMIHEPLIGYGNIVRIIISPCSRNLRSQVSGCRARPRPCNQWINGVRMACERGS